MTSALSRQEGGDHYVGLAIQPAEYAHANGLGHMEGDAIAYITRWRVKGGLADLRKAIHSLEILIELEERVAEVDAEEDDLATGHGMFDLLTALLRVPPRRRPKEPA